MSAPHSPFIELFVARKSQPFGKASVLRGLKENEEFARLFPQNAGSLNPFDWPDRPALALPSQQNDGHRRRPGHPVWRCGAACSSGSFRLLVVRSSRRDVAAPNLKNSLVFLCGSYTERVSAISGNRLSLLPLRNCFFCFVFCYVFSPRSTVSSVLTLPLLLKGSKK